MHMIPKSGNRFSEKIIRKMKKAQAVSQIETPRLP